MAFGNSSMNSSMAVNDYQIPQTLNDGIQDLSWSPTSNLLVSGSWDNRVRCWEIQQQNAQMNAVPKAEISHAGPVLCTAFSRDGNTVFSGSCDKTAKMWQLGQPQGQQIAAHDAPIKCIAAVQEKNCVVTGSWDKTIKYWDSRTPNPQATVNLPDRCYAMDVKYPLMVVGTADRQVIVINLEKPTEIYRTISSPLKYQTRTVCCFPDKTGFAIGSVEGRVGIHHVDENNSAKNFAFKCHRENTNIYAVNSIDFHPRGAFATAGSDGTFCFWDKDQKQRLKSFPKKDLPITCGKFNSRGDIYAYVVSYDWSKGAENYNTSKPSTINLHYVTDNELVSGNKKK